MELAIMIGVVPLPDCENCAICQDKMEVPMAYIKSVKQLLERKYGDKVLYAHVHSYGCQQNVSDGEKIMGMLALMGYGFCDSPNEADLLVYNTCAVRENAEGRVFGNIGELKNIKPLNENMIIAVCGCMMQQEHIAQKVKLSYPFVDIVFGTHVLDEVPKMLYQALTGKKRVFNTDDSRNEIIEGIPIKREVDYKASVPIMYGCNNFCTYCIVPYVRGREISRKSQDILNEVQNLVNAGCKEITLLGQNVNSYGGGLEEEINFAKLLIKINALEGDFRIRFMSSHPKDATFELMDAIAACDKVCKHFHLPVQSGSNRILKKMNRNYTTDDYLKLVAYARSKMPHIAFTSDIIVGFPGETPDDFSKTIELIKAVSFDSIFSFIYSKRVGTKAFDMFDKTSAKEKSARFSQLLKTQREIGTEKYKHCLGNTYRVLVDGKGKTGSEYMTGRSDGYMIIDFIGDKNLLGKFVNVKITKALNWALLGEIVD